MGCAQVAGVRRIRLVREPLSDVANDQDRVVTIMKLGLEAAKCSLEALSPRAVMVRADLSSNGRESGWVT